MFARYGLAILGVAQIFTTSFGFAATIQPTAPFDPAEASWFKTQGRNALTGTASVRAADGTSHNCAHGAVQLSPVTKYSMERINIVFGSVEPDFVSVAQMPIPPRPDPAGAAYQLLKQCDDAGHFEFQDLPDGDYYLVVEVTWRSASGTDIGGGQRLGGGAFARRLSLRGGEMRDVKLAR